jgi:hypothetical protein
MPQLPKYAYDLIDMLDEAEGVPQFPSTRTGVVNLDESQIRLGVWHAARRALVDELLAMREEDEDEAADNQASTSDNPGSVLDTPILDPSGERHRSVASVHLAPTGPTTD